MKTKFKIPNKILSLLLSLVVMVGMIPMMSMTVHAALSYKSSIPKENRVYTVNLNNFVISEEESLSNVKSCLVYSYSRSGSKVTLEIYIVYLKTSTNRTDSFSANLSFDDGECTTELAEITRTLYHPKTSAIYGTFSIKRNAIAHTGTATCTTPATCTRCGVSFGTTNNSHNWGDWISNKNGTHTRTCTYNSDHKENGNCSHSAATCLAASVCPVCNHTYVAQLSHNYTYTATDNTVIEACPNGCKHSKTATLNADAEYTYTGSSITPATINFPDGWVGNTVENTAISYENNLNVGTATASVNIEGKTATKTFEIKAADIGDATVTLNPESSTYSGSEQKPEISVTWNNTKLVEGTHYTVSWNKDKIGFITPDTYTATIEGTGNFEGNKTATFIITDADITVIEVKQKDTLTYNGKEQTPAVSASAKSVNNQTIAFKYSTEKGNYGDMPTFKEAGTYTVYYQATADITSPPTVSLR